MNGASVTLREDVLKQRLQITTKLQNCFKEFSVYNCCIGGHIYTSCALTLTFYVLLSLNLSLQLQLLVEWPHGTNKRELKYLDDQSIVSVFTQAKIWHIWSHVSSFWNAAFLCGYRYWMRSLWVSDCCLKLSLWALKNCYQHLFHSLLNIS